MYNRNNIKKIAMIIVWFLVIAMIVTTFSFSIFGLEKPAANKSLDSQMENLKDLIELIDSNYVEEVNTDELVNNAIQGVMDSLDPFSTYYSDGQQGSQTMDNISGITYGIGVTMVDDENGCRVTDAAENMPAYAAGIQKGDYIIEVDGVSVSENTAAEIAEKLQGKKNTTVSIKISRDGSIKTFNITRAEMPKASVRYGMMDDTTAYINISRMYENTTTEFKEAYLTLEEEHPNMSGLIVDIRNNAGGVLSTAITLSNLFLDKDDIITTLVTRDVATKRYRADGNRLVYIPTVILVNNKTASASELFAAALAENDVAELVGAVTYGKSFGQTMYELESGSAVSLSVLNFYTPKANNYQGVGITPSYIIYNGDNKAAISRYNSMKTVAAMDEGKKYKPNEKGLNVYAAQQRLIILGYDVELNGTLDEKTQTALKDIQLQSALYVYGYLDFTTMKALESIYQQNVFPIEDDIQLDKAREILGNNAK